MLKPLLVACLVGIGTFAIVAGCSAPSTDGDVKKGSSSRGDDDDDDTTPKKGTSSSSGEVAADCTSLPKADDRPACDQCTRSKCCKQYAACQASPACKAQADCIAAAPDAISALTCGLDESELGDLGNCAATACKAECPSTLTLDGGGFGSDPFGDDDAG